jgi:hypothetical protein
MGLDMYARTLAKELIPDEHQVDVEVEGIALVAVGFEPIAPDIYCEMTDEAKEQYRNRRSAAYKKAVGLELLDSEFAYWRKFYALHEWMSKLYYKKGGTDESFNCNTVRVDPSDLIDLQIFAYESDVLTAEDVEDINKFIYKCHKAHKQQKVVFYDSWW